jgi:prephenate dehydratase
VLGLPGATLERASIVRSHPAAFDQCRDLLRRRHLRQIPAATTADAAREVAGHGDPAQVAIASSEAAETYGLEVLADDVGDRPGALYRALGALARADVNLVQLVSRPLPSTAFRYRVDVVLDGHVFDPRVRPALADLRALTREVRLFGSYAAEGTR